MSVYIYTNVSIPIVSYQESFQAKLIALQGSAQENLSGGLNGCAVCCIWEFVCYIRV